MSHEHNSCHDHHKLEPAATHSSCCAPSSDSAASCCAPKTETVNHCCPSDSSTGKAKLDWLLWGSLILCVLFYSLNLFELEHDNWIGVISHSVFELLNTMWWSVALAVVFVGLLNRIPQNFILSILGPGGSFKGLWRATAAGVLMDLCSHGILAVGMELRRKGASLGQVMAFLIASPWNSLSLTLIMIALIGLSWTLAFIALSMLIALVSGWIFDRLEKNGTLPALPFSHEVPADFKFWQEARTGIKTVSWDSTFVRETFKAGLQGSRMVIRWLLFGVLLASAIRGFVSLEDFQNYFGPSLLGLGATLIAATIIEVCSEGSTPIAADLMNRANAPGNSFAFLMTGVATDYTEIMVIKDTTNSWKTALFLPLITVPQVIVIAWLLNGTV